MPRCRKPDSELLPTKWVSKAKRMKRESAGPAACSFQPAACLLQHRPYQRAVFMKWKEESTGLIALLWRRQGGKTTTLAELAVKQMLRRPGRLVTFASVSLLCGRELVYKESQVFLRALAALRQQAAAENCRLEVYDGKTERQVGCAVPSAPEDSSTANGGALGTARPTISADDFAELYEAQRLEFRLYHGNGVYSRTQVIAPNPATARGWTGDVLLDEIGFIDDLREVWEAMEPIVSSDPDFRVVMSTTPPDDDAHFAFELLAPGERKQAASEWCGTETSPSPLELERKQLASETAIERRQAASETAIERRQAASAPEEFPVNPEGNWYRSAGGILVHRCDIYDAAAAGAPVYDLETRAALTPEEHFARALDKEAWRRNYGLQFLAGGASAVPLAELAHAQQAGQGQGLFVQVENLDDLEAGLNFLRAHLTNGAVGVGWDLATTEKLTSNPSALAVIERVGPGFVARLVLVWKTAEPQEAENRVRAVLQCIAERGEGGPARRLCIDATNERYFAGQVAKALNRDKLSPFQGQVLVEPIVASETTKVPGEKEPITFKALLGHQLLNALEDGRLALPPGRYIKEDFRLVKRNRGAFETQLSPQGMHGDTFEACKLALRAATARAAGPVALVA